MRIIDQFRDFSDRLSIGVAESLAQAHAFVKKSWRRSWTGRVVWPWLRSEVEVVAKVAGVVTLSLWLKRLIEQFLGAKVLNEAILRGESNDIIGEIEHDIIERRSKHGRRRK